MELMGELLLYAGTDKVIWGTDSGGATKEIINAFKEIQIDEDLRKGYGYPEFADEMKAKMFALNMARLLGIEATKRVGKTAGAAKA
jgi:uncharacterized protein